MELNDIVQVKLTERGAKIINEQNASLKLTNPSLSFKTDYKKGDIYRNELWEVFRNFGNSCYMGVELPFVNLIKE